MLRRFESEPQAAAFHAELRRSLSHLMPMCEHFANGGRGYKGADVDSSADIASDLAEQLQELNLPGSGVLSCVQLLMVVICMHMDIAFHRAVILNTCVSNQALNYPLITLSVYHHHV